jgi:hypothetical protein
MVRELPIVVNKSIQTKTNGVTASLTPSMPTPAAALPAPSAASIAIPSTTTA